MSARTVGLAEIAGAFLKIGAMSYGGPAIMGIMQTEIQEKREWISKQEFVEGLALVNMLPGPGASQLGIFIGHAKAGLTGGILAGICCPAGVPNHARPCGHVCCVWHAPHDAK